MDDISKVMVNAREDLAGNIAGDFSPADWAVILERARDLLARAGQRPEEAWPDVIRTFHRERYWGFRPDYRAPRVKQEEQNLGKRFIWYVSRSFLITKVAVLYFGARWTAGYDPINGYLFFGAMIFMVSNYGYFLWKFRDRDDEWRETPRD